MSSTGNGVMTLSVEGYREREEKRFLSLSLMRAIVTVRRRAFFYSSYDGRF